MTGAADFVGDRFSFVGDDRPVLIFAVTFLLGPPVRRTVIVRCDGDSRRNPFKWLLSLVSVRVEARLPGGGPWEAIFLLFAGTTGFLVVVVRALLVDDKVSLLFEMFRVYFRLMFDVELDVEAMESVDLRLLVLAALVLGVAGNVFAVDGLLFGMDLDLGVLVWLAALPAAGVVVSVGGLYWRNK